MEPKKTSAVKHQPFEKPVVIVRGGNYSSAQEQAAQKRVFRKRWLAVLALVFFFFSIIFIIPVSSIPGLRNLVWLMGFTPENIQSMSFGRALLTWVGDKSSRSVSNDEEFSLFDRDSASVNAGASQSSLFDVALVNAARRKKGLSAEEVAGIYEGMTDEQRAALQRQVRGWSQEAIQAQEQNKAKEVYFGTDADMMGRSSYQAEEIPSDTVGLLPKANIVGSVKTDWFGQAVDKASLLTNIELDKALDKGSSASTPLSKLDGKMGGEEKAKRDLARAWLMNRAATRAKQPMLKKQLASAGYTGMDMPKKVYDSLGENSGVMMSGDEVMKDFETINQQLLNEKECRRLGDEANSNVNVQLKESRTLIKQIRSTVPKSCDAITGWKESLIEVETKCKEVKTTFTNMKTACGVKLSSEGTCEAVRLNTYAEELKGACDAIEAAKLEEPIDEEKIALLEQARDEVVEGLTEEEVFNTFNLGAEGDTSAGSGDFFPVTEENKSWLLDIR